MNPQEDQYETEPFELLFHSLERAGELAKALSARGFVELTEVQQAVLSPELAGRDLRISSQTGSGKTVALGFVVAGALNDAEDADGSEPSRSPSATPAVLAVVPTRELAAQLGYELSWLYGNLGVGIAVVTGGTSIGGDLRALRDGPKLVIGTPGRLVDHLERGALDLSHVTEVVLDEADEMLDMGFRDELEAILNRTPQQRRTHLVSATFPPKVKALANLYQRDAVLVEGTVGSQHEDIDHSAIVVEASQRIDVLVNLMLLQPEQRFLVFVRTRVAASGVAGQLASLGLSAAPLSGEMAQRERTRCLADFRARKLQCVVATDVAARGLDIRGVQKVVHYDIPENREAFTHRSGRTGRAGEKGESVMLTTPRGRRRIEALFRLLEIDASWRQPPTPAKIRRAQRRRMLRRYGPVVSDVGGEVTDTPPGAESSESDRLADTASRAPEEIQRIAAQLLERRDAEALVADLLQDVVGLQGNVEPREIRAPVESKSPKPGGARAGRAGRSSHGARDSGGGHFEPFHVTWGSKTGATPPRVLAHVCRRGGIEGRQVGSIKIHDFRCVVDIAADVAASFEDAVKRPDPKNPRVFIQRFVPYDQRKQRPGDRDRGPARAEKRGKGRPPWKGGKPSRPKRGS